MRRNEPFHIAQNEGKGHRHGPEAFRAVFKGIEADNGSGFLDHEPLERPASSGTRTHIYRAHPCSSRERGGNEIASRMIRQVGDWMNGDRFSTKEGGEGGFSLSA